MSEVVDDERRPPPPIALVPPGDREPVSESRAQDFVAEWKSLLAEHRSEVVKSLASIRGYSSEEEVPEEEIPPHPVEKVVLSDKAYTAAAAEVLFNFFTRETSNGSPSIAAGVKVLDMSDVIAGLPEAEGLQVLSLLSSAFEHSDLVEVDLSDNAMGSKGVSACRAVLTGQSGSLERLSMCNNGLSAEAMDEVADILTGVSGGSGGASGEGTEDDALATDGSAICERLTKLHFYSNMSGDGGCRAFARILHRCTDRLVDVRFSGTRAGEGGSAVVAAALDEMGDKICALRRLDLADNTFRSPDSSAVLCRVLGRCGELTHLNLRDCSLDDENEEGTSRVCHAVFGASPPLEHLDLSGNEMTGRGADSLADLLVDLGGTLRVLRAEDNELKSTGVKKIARAIYHIGADAIAAAEGGAEADDGIAQQAAGGCVLEEICLGNTECGNIGARALLDAYRKGEGLPRLRSVDLDGNGFTSDMVAELKYAFGDKLNDMDDNDEDAGFDDDLDSDGEEDDDDDEEGGGGHGGGSEGGDGDDGDVGREEAQESQQGGGATGTDEVDELADQLAAGASISHELV